MYASLSVSRGHSKAASQNGMRNYPNNKKKTSEKTIIHGNKEDEDHIKHGETHQEVIETVLFLLHREH